MALQDKSVLPLASIRLFDPGEGDATLIAPEWRWYDVLRESANLGTPSYDSTGVPQVEYVDGAGLVCRGFLQLQDTRLSQFTTSGGTWDEQRPFLGAPLKYRIMQTDSTANLAWSATSTYPLPENFHCAFSFVFCDVPPDHDTVANPPFIRVEFGAGSYLWAIECSKLSGCHLMQYSSNLGQWVIVLPLSEPASIAGGGDLTERLFLVRHFRNRIFISTDFGQSYQSFGTADGSDAFVPAAPFVLRGLGGMCLFGIHQLKYSTATYTSPTKGMALAIPPSGIPTMTGRGAAPYGTSASFTDLSNPVALVAQYQATLTPATVAAAPFTFYYSPELYAVKYKFPPTLLLGSGSYTTPWDGAIVSVDIEKPYELDSTTATIRIRRDAAVQFTGEYRWRKIQILLGEYDADGSTVWYTAFTGYLRKPEPGQHEFNRATLTLQADGPAIRARRSEWEDDTTPLGWQTVNAALDEVLFSMGLTALDRIWHNNGNLVLLDSGLAEDPCLWPKGGETKMETMQKLAAFADCDIGVTNDGTWVTVLKEFVQPHVSYTWKAVPSAAAGDDQGQAIRKLSSSIDYSQSRTGIKLRGKDAYGNAICAYVVDAGAELLKGSGRFCPWPERTTESIDGTTTQGMLNVIAQVRAGELLQLKQEAELSVPVSLSVARRDRVQVQGTTCGIADFDEWAVLTLAHKYVMDPSGATLETTAGLRKVAPTKAAKNASASGVP